MKIEVSGITNVGNIRELNEDSYAIRGFEENQPSGVCILADGMGGHNAGEIASQHAVSFVDEVLGSNYNRKETEIPGLLAEAVSHANKEIYELALHTPGQHGMGTTLVIGFITDTAAYIANVGDSRAYAIRDGELCRITVDHSIVEELVANGTITREEAFHHPQKNIITRAVGTDPTIKTDVYEYTYLPGDIMLMCSDGLTEMVTEDDIMQIVSNGAGVQDILEQLVQAALNAGGHDNITVIALRFCEEEFTND